MDDNVTGTCRFCDRPIRHSLLRVCYRCYSYLRVWRDRPIGDKRERKAQLESLNERMEYMLVATSAEMPKRKKVKASNVVTLTRRKVRR